MCGICGVYSPTLGPREIQAFRNLLLINQVRGEDSTGVARVTQDGKVNMLRGLGESSKFLASETAKAFLQPDTKPMLLLGHCRAATIGSVSANNIHPFAFKNIVGVMNGTFKGEFENHLRYATDTEAIYYNMNESLEKDGSIIPGLEASMVYDPQFALAFIDLKHNTLNFIKNDKRPLHFAYINSRKTLVWSSTSEHLEFIVKDIMAFEMSGWKANEKDPVWTLHEHNLYQIKIGQPASSGEITGERIKPKKMPAITYTNPQGAFYSEMVYNEEDWQEYMDDDAPVGGSSKEVFKCADGQYRTKEAEARRLGSTFRPPNSGPGATITSSGGVDGGGRGKVAGSEDSGTTPDSKRNRKRSGTSNAGADDFSTLSWLNDLEEADKREEEARRTEKELAKRYKTTVLAEVPGAQEDRKPKSTAELKFRLKQGCMCCGRVIEYNQPEHVLKIKWWNREAWACGDCYDNPETDWVKYSIDGTWDQYKPPTGVSVH